MKALKIHIYFIFNVLILILASRAFAQPNAQPVYNSTIDQLNCETIRFIHREAGRAEIANNMECFSFEAILKTIPDDESRTTGQVAKDIEAFKTRFKADAELGPQLDNVIAYIHKKIQAKPRRGNVNDFKQKLQDYKAEALENISGAANNQPTQNTGETALDEEEEQGIVLSDTETKPAGETNWLGWLAFIFSVAALAIALYLLSQLGKLKNATDRSEYPHTEPDTNSLRSPQTSEINEKLQAFDARIDKEIARLQQEFDEKLAAVTASTGYTQPENYTAAGTAASNNDEQEEEEEHFLPTPVDQADAPILTTEERMPEPEETDNEAPATQRIIMDDIEEDDDNENDEKQPQHVNNTFAEEDEDDAEEETETPAVQNVFRSDSSSEMAPPAVAQNIVTEEDDEDAVALPEYKYIGLPLPDGSFSPQSFTDSPTEDSLYEVEMYEDVPNKAFFSPLQYPEIIEKTIADPEKYLAPCCMFLNDANGKTILNVVEEGRLRRQGERWYIYEKARIRFD